MFMGEYNHSIDAKGRIIIPSKFRESLGETFVLTLGLDGCLFVYPNSEWESFLTKLNSLPGSKEARQLQRYFLAGATECEVDKQGRILIPTKLRNAAALDKDVIFVGVLSKIEIWSKEKWDEENAAFVDNSDEVALQMEELGI